MSLPHFSVRRPIFTTMIMLMVVIIGVVALSRLRIDLLPEIEMPTLSVSTSYQNASPEVVERLVTQIVEEILATVPGVEEMTSTSSEGRSNVRMRFAWGTNLDAAVADVRSRLEDELSELPEDIDRPEIRKFDIASYPVVILGISSKLDPVELTELIDTKVRYRFARVPGVAQADLFGGYQREIRVELDPGRIKALGLPLDTVLAALRNANLDRPTGEINQGRFEVTLRAPGEFANLKQIRQTVVAVRDGAPIKLAQIAEVKDTYRKLTRIVRVNGDPGLRIGIRKQANANTVEVSNAILREIRRVNEDFPQIQVVSVANQGNFIERSIDNVARSVLYGGVLAVIVLLFFLRQLRSTFIIAMAIPISVIATFALIYFGGFTINLMTLGGLALGVGMMVDNAIVVLENIHRRCTESGESPAVASARGTDEVTSAIVASTITTLVIFLPLIFVRGVTSILFREFAYVIVFALLCSLWVALSLVPMLCSRMLRPLRTSEDKPGAFSSWIKASEKVFQALEAFYQNTLALALRFRAISILITCLMLGASLLLAPLIGTEFLPPSDEGEVRVTGELEVGTRLDLIDRQSQRMEQLVTAVVPEIDSYVVSIGSSSRSAEVSRTDISMSLVPAAHRERSNADIAADLRKYLKGKVAGMTVRTRAPQGQFVLERILGDEEGLTIEVRGYDLDVLAALSHQVSDALQHVQGITDVEYQEDIGVPQQLIHIDRDKAADLGLSVRDIAQTLEIALAGREAGDFRTRGNAYRILVQMADAEHMEMDEILELTLTSDRGEDIALRNVVSAESGRGPILIHHKDQQRVITLQANVAGRDMGSIARDVQKRLQDIPRPADHELIVSGQFQEQEEAFSELLVSLILALVLVYMVLACQYESLRDPIVVMLSVPLAIIGVAFTLFLTKTTMNVQSYIGCIMLGGIVVNNAILLVDQAGRLRRDDGMSTQQAVVEAGRRRLRPILMTTLTTMLGLLPLALGIGEGAEAQAPLARAVMGGLGTSTLITLLIVPVIYVLFYPDPREIPS